MQERQITIDYANIQWYHLSYILSGIHNTIFAPICSRDGSSAICKSILPVCRFWADSRQISQKMHIVYDDFFLAFHYDSIQLEDIK